MRPVSRLTVTRIDYASSIFFMLMVMSVFFVVAIFGIAGVVLFGYLYYKRSTMVMDVLSKGEEVKGILSQKTYYKRWNMMYTYAVGNRQYTTQNLLAFTWPKTQVGDEITVIYDPQKPETAFVKEFYIS